MRRHGYGAQISPFFCLAFSVRGKEWNVLIWNAALQAAVEARNQILYDVVSAAATLKDEPKSRKLNGGDADGRHVVDWDSIPGGVRINMRPSAVAVT